MQRIHKQRRDETHRNWNNFKSSDPRNANSCSVQNSTTECDDSKACHIRQLKPGAKAPFIKVPFCKLTNNNCIHRGNLNALEDGEMTLKYRNKKGADFSPKPLNKETERHCYRTETKSVPRDMAFKM